MTPPTPFRTAPGRGKLRPDQITAAAARYVAGETLQEIAPGLEVTTEGLRLRLLPLVIMRGRSHARRKRGPGARTIPKERLQEAITRYAGGENLAALANWLGCHRWTVAATLRAAGVSLRTASEQLRLQGYQGQGGQRSAECRQRMAEARRRWHATRTPEQKDAWRVSLREGWARRKVSTP